MSVHLWPPGGLAHPVFDAAGEGDHVLAIFTFAGSPNETALQGVERALDAWSKAAGRLNREYAVHAEEPFFTRTALRVRAHNLQHPREAMTRLMQRIESASPLAEAFFARLEPIGGDRFAPARDPAMPREQAHFHDAAEFLACLFDEACAPPASEYESQLGGGLALPDGDLAVEERGMPLFYSGLRLGYGTASRSFSESDARAQEVAAVLRKRLDEALAGLKTAPPPFFDHHGRAGAVDRIAALGRVGYGFGIPSAALTYRYAHRLYRYREPELFGAIESVVAELGLSRSVCWQRFGEPLKGGLRSVHTHVIQLWTH
jgi:hypothetical protein